MDKRFATLLDQLSGRPTHSIPAACGGWAETHAAYRFFDNAKVTPDKVLAPHREATVRRCGEHPVVLVAQDTSELELTRPLEKVGGPLGDEEHWGFHIHPCLALTPDRIPLGVLNAQMWARDPDDFHKRHKARTKPIEEKESFRWLEGYRHACALRRRIGGRVVSLSDSEGDIYECFAVWLDDAEGPTADFIVRACQNRRVVPAEEEPDAATLLWDAVERSAVRGRRTIEVSMRPALTGDGSKRRQARSARTTTVTLRSATVTLRGLRRPGAGEKLPDVTVNVVLVREESPPPGEPAVEWLLVTSLPVATLAEIETVVDYYCCRWQIEISHPNYRSSASLYRVGLAA